MNTKQCFDYDLWANRLWIPVAEALGEADILEHLVDSQETWLARCRRKAAPDRDALPLTERFKLSHDDWLDFLAGPRDQAIDYENSRGERYSNEIDAIVQHVINHGTYHRGQLRGIAGERGVAFPETDLIAFIRMGATVS